jgi:maleate isomerase
MADQVNIGFVNAGSSGRVSPHMTLFNTLIPPDVRFDAAGLGVLDESTDDFDIRYDLHGDLGPLLDKTNQIVAERGWDGVIMAAAPLEVMNPGLGARLNEGVSVPVTTALNACTNALKAVGAKRVLLMTPFTERMNARIRADLAGRGIEATTFGEFEKHTQAMALEPEEVRARAQAALDQAGNVDAIYFQGAVLDPLQVIDTLEQEAEMPVIASNPAMLWFILSKLGHRYSIEGYGKLLGQWPTLSS